MKMINETDISKLKRTSVNETLGRLFFLEASVGRILSEKQSAESKQSVATSGTKLKR
jgi:hypothetical protein